MTFLLDTDHVSLLEHPGTPEYAAILAKIAAQPAGEVGVSVLSYQEQSKGCNNLINRATNPQALVAAYSLHYRILDFFRSFPLVPFDLAAATESDRLRGLKLGIGTMDLRIAAIALARHHRRHKERRRLRQGAESGDRRLDEVAVTSPPRTS